MNSVSKVKIAVGYTLLLAVLFFSLFFVHREPALLLYLKKEYFQASVLFQNTLTQASEQSRKHPAAAECSAQGRRAVRSAPV